MYVCVRACVSAYALAGSRVCLDPTFVEACNGPGNVSLLLIGYFSSSLGLSKKVDTIQLVMWMRNLKLREGKALV